MQKMVNAERQKTLDRKAMFVGGLGIVFNELSDLEIKKMRYRFDEKSGRELVDVYFNSGVIRAVDVTSDSHLAILIDLTKALR